MGGVDNSDMRFQRRGESSINCPSSVMNTNPLTDKVEGLTMSSVSMYKSSNGADRFFASTWDPMISLGQHENFGGSSMVSHGEFAANPPYPVVQYPSDSSFVEMVPKLQSFGSGNFSEMVGSFGLPECGQIVNAGCPPNYTSSREGGAELTSTNGAQSSEGCQISEEAAIGASSNGKRRKRPVEPNPPLNSNKNFESDLEKDFSGQNEDGPREQNEKTQRTEQNSGANLRGKQVVNDNSNGGEAPKENYIHVRARRGQATNSHSLAERVRREKISERMRLLQELVPGCNKITGKAVMLDEIINYVQSLQQQVEFLSMKLATVNPELNIDIERILSKDILHSRDGGAAILGYGAGMNSNPYSHGIFPGTMPLNPQFPIMHPTVLDNELHSLCQMGFDPSSSIDNLGPSGRLKPEL